MKQQDVQAKLTPMRQLGLFREGMDIVLVVAEDGPDVRGSVFLGLSMDCLHKILNLEH
jgi:hypothetical protein